MGTQLVVKPGQWALFVKHGKILDVFVEGTYTLNSANIPLMSKLIGLPFGGDTPFQAEVWFVNKLSKLNNRFGTAIPLQLEDPKYGLIVPVRAFGMFGFRVEDPRCFLETLVGTARVFGADKIVEYFNARVLSSVASAIGGCLVNQGISIVQIAARLDEISQFCRERITAEFQRYGLILSNFYFESINVPSDDPSYIKLKQLKEKAAELSIIGRDIYQYDKSMDVLKTAAGNEGVGGSIMQAGIGMGMGTFMGGQIGMQAGQMMTQLPPVGVPPPHPTVSQFYVLLNGQQQGPFGLQVLQTLASSGGLNSKTLIWRNGLTEWQEAGFLNELNGLWRNSPPPSPSTGGPPPVPPVS